MPAQRLLTGSGGDNSNEPIDVEFKEVGPNPTGPKDWGNPTRPQEAAQEATGTQEIPPPPPPQEPLQAQPAASRFTRARVFLVTGIVVILLFIVFFAINKSGDSVGKKEAETAAATHSTATVLHFTPQYKSVMAPVGSYSEPLELSPTQCLGLTGEGEVPRDAKFVWQTYWNGNWSDPVAATLKAQLPRNSSKVRFTSHTGAPQHVLVTLIPCGAPDMVAIRKKS